MGKMDLHPPYIGVKNDRQNSCSKSYKNSQPLDLHHIVEYGGHRDVERGGHSTVLCIY